MQDFKDDLLGQHNKATPSKETALESPKNRKPRRDEYHEGFILKGESL